MGREQQWATGGKGGFATILQYLYIYLIVGAKYYNTALLVLNTAIFIQLYIFNWGLHCTFLIHRKGGFAKYCNIYTPFGMFDFMIRCTISLVIFFILQENMVHHMWWEENVCAQSLKQAHKLYVSIFEIWNYQSNNQNICYVPECSPSPVIDIIDIGNWWRPKVCRGSLNWMDLPKSVTTDHIPQHIEPRWIYIHEQASKLKEACFPLHLK